MSKTHVIDGETYVEVERKAEVGEKIIIVSPMFDYADGGKRGDFYTVNQIRTDCCTHEEYFLYGVGVKEVDIIFLEREYRVLVPVADAQPPLELTANDIRWQPDKVIDLLANLAHRVSSLEKQLVDTQGNVERQAEEIAELKHLTESNEEDIRELDDRTQVINAIQKHYDGGAR